MRLDERVGITTWAAVGVGLARVERFVAAAAHVIAANADDARLATLSGSATVTPRHRRDLPA
jgi:hypothetical protein